ncbi:uncharacterized protein BJ171DRAFT_163458 [Polychytrium aggregatum]|uniref:uncharacterized protein n=1 Tax=Polychytrium aggregatum TaxID=110093 RepID=UPI0022FE498D|nr:uncharacterized protein BJ171DRAFT_163458 [Polychytrium aggregatum]KAI9202902.1 hypothetical protein BJ171DRAFT_163458 [Polychytrium aggregatum]
MIDFLQYTNPAMQPPMYHPVAPSSRPLTSAPAQPQALSISTFPQGQSLYGMQALSPTGLTAPQRTVVGSFYPSHAADMANPASVSPFGQYPPASTPNPAAAAVGAAPLGPSTDPRRPYPSHPSASSGYVAQVSPSSYGSSSSPSPLVPDSNSLYGPAGSLARSHHSASTTVRPSYHPHSYSPYPTMPLLTRPFSPSSADNSQRNLALAQSPSHPVYVSAPGSNLPVLSAPVAARTASQSIHHEYSAQPFGHSPYGSSSTIVSAGSSSLLGSSTGPLASPPIVTAAAAAAITAGDHRIGPILSYVGPQQALPTATGEPFYMGAGVAPPISASNFGDGTPNYADEMAFGRTSFETTPDSGQTISPAMEHYYPEPQYTIRGGHYEMSGVDPSTYNHMSQNMISCPHDDCTRTFSKQTHLRAHLKSHQNERNHQCNTCGSTFRRSHDLRRHERSLHSTDRPYECLVCHKTFSRMDALKRHSMRSKGPCKTDSTEP